MKGQVALQRSEALGGSPAEGPGRGGGLSINKHAVGIQEGPAQGHHRATTGPPQGHHRGIGRAIELPYRALFVTFLLIVIPFYLIYVVLNIRY